MQSRQEDTIVALATPPGIGAIGVIRLSGPAAISIVQSVFRGKALDQQASHTVHFGHILEGGHVLDEVVVTLFKAPHSFTREHVVEIGCHGSEFIIRHILQLLVRQGARAAQPGEFTQRAFLNGRFDLVQAEAVADLIASESQAAHELAMQQMRGGFSKKIAASREELIRFAAMIELELDFGEEDVEFASRSELRSLILDLLRQIRPLLDSFSLGNVLKNGVPVVLAGRPNAGKSTLLNALLNEERAIVSEVAGTTRDTIEENLNIQGLLFKLIDTAGLREAQDQIEAIGIRKSLEKVAQSSYVLYLFDASTFDAASLQEDLEKLQKPQEEILLVATKMDRLPGWTPDRNMQSFGPFEALPLSAPEGIHIDLLKEKLYQLAMSQQQTESDVRISNLRHYEALDRTHQALEDALSGLDQGLSGDLLAQQIRLALHHLGTLTGDITTDDLLDFIFSKFCIGK